MCQGNFNPTSGNGFLAIKLPTLWRTLLCIPLVLRLEEGLERHGAVLHIGCRPWSLGTMRDKVKLKLSTCSLCQQQIC